MIAPMEAAPSLRLAQKYGGVKTKVMTQIMARSVFFFVALMALPSATGALLPCAATPS
jgi:hypothetical protein